MLKSKLAVGAMLLVVLGCSSKQPESIEARAVIGAGSTIKALASIGSGFEAFADVEAGILYVVEGREEKVLTRYKAEKVSAGWRISRGGWAGVFQLAPMKSLNLSATMPGAAFATMQDALCTSIRTTGTCVNMFSVETGAFMYSWKTPTGGLSWCTSSPGDTCDFTTKSTGTARTWRDRDCPEGGAAGGQDYAQICEDNLE